MNDAKGERHYLGENVYMVKCAAISYRIKGLQAGGRTRVRPRSLLWDRLPIIDRRKGFRNV
jgi:hypothetical protein